MTRSQVAGIYSSAGLALFLFALNLFWLERTGSAVLKVVVPHARIPSAILIGAVGISVVGMFVLYIVERFWKAAPAQPLALPPAFSSSDSADPLARLLRLTAYMAFVVLPTAAAIHFLVYLSELAILDHRGELPSFPFWSFGPEFWAPGTWFGETRFRIDDPDGVSFFPVVEPLVLTLLVAIQLAWTLSQIWRLFVYRPPAEPDRLFDLP